MIWLSAISYKVFMRRSLSSIQWGLIFVGIGIGLFGNIFGFWNYNVFFRGWWTLFLIVPAVISMIQTGVRMGNSIVLGIGVLLFLEQQRVIPYGLIWKAAAPAVLIIIGLAIISKAVFKRPANGRSVLFGKTVINSEDNPNYFALFSGNTVKNNSTNFQGGNATSLFGGNEIDLSDVVLAGDVVFTVTSIFGGSEIRAPKNARIEMKGLPIFGGNENTAVSSADPEAYKITFECTSIFGGTEIN